MKKKIYFAKYIPVEGEIKEGDIVQGDSGIYYQIKTFDTMNGSSPSFAISTKGQSLILNRLNKVKLMLCSRDIKYNEKFFFKDNPEEMLNEGGGDAGDTWCGHGKMLYAKSECYKVIGEISPDALSYVNRRDEFDEDQIQRWSLSRRVGELDWIKVDKSIVITPEKTYGWLKESYRIKGPCGHFH